MQLRLVVAVSSLVLALPLASVSAQTATQSAQTTTPATAKWSFSLGVDPTAFDLNTPEPGINARMVANLTRSWQSGNSRWARRISLMVGTDAPRVEQPIVPPLFAPPCNCAMRVMRTYAGLTAGASYDVFRVWRFTPYLTGGTGMYYSAYRRRPEDFAPIPSEYHLYKDGGFAQSKLSLGVNAGLGLKIRLGSHEIFIEQMLHEFDINNHGLGVYPLNIGIRF